MKRILIFSLAYYPHVGGAEVAIKEITDRVADIQFDMVTLRMSATDAVTEKVGNVTVYRVAPFGVGYISKALYPVAAALKARQLHTEHYYSGFWAMMGYMVFPIVLLRMLGIRVPYAITLQEGDTFEHVFRRLHILPVLPLMRYGFRHATVVQTISHFLATWARSIGYPREPVVIPNGVNAAAFTGEPIPHTGTILITTSRLVHKNATDDVVRALALLPGVRFKVIGVGPDEALLKALAVSLGVEKRVEFAGFVKNERLPQELHVADIFIRPSRSEGFGISFVEAFAAGIPVIATQEGGIADFLFDAKRNPDKETTGWAVDKNSPDQIAEAVKDILAHPDQVKKVVATAKKMVTEKYDWNLIAKKMRDKVFAILL
jgi:glycosyltransferase involved in cell wall biosynthesis